MGDKTVHILNRSLAVMAILFFLSLSLNSFSQRKENIDLDNYVLEEGLDSLLISIQELMSVDSSTYLLKKESIMLKILMTEYEDFYALTKNLFLLDYSLERKDDKVSKAILRYWMGYYMMTHNLYDNTIALWEDIEQDIPSFLLPELYLNNGRVQMLISNYESALLNFYKIEALTFTNDSLRWNSKVNIASVYSEQKEAIKEIDFWEETLKWLVDKDEVVWNIYAYKQLANANKNIELYDLSIIYLNKANELHESFDPGSPDLYHYYVDIALIFELKGDKSKSVAYLKAAGKEMHTSENHFSEAKIFLQIAQIYFDELKLHEADAYNLKAIGIAKENSYNRTLSKAYYLAYEINEELGYFEKALNSYALYADINQRFNEEEKEKLRDIYERQYQIERAEKQYKLIIASEELKDFELEQFRLEKEKNQAQINFLEEQQRKNDVEIQNKTLMASESENKLSLANKSSEIRDLETAQQIKQLQIDEQRSKDQANKQEIEKLVLENKNAELTLDKEIQKKNRVRRFSLFVVIIVILLIVFLRTKTRANRVLQDKNLEIAYQHREIEVKNNKLAAEKSKSDSLLLNILPEDTAEELKLNGKTLPKLYDSVSILFTDYVGFTSLTNKMDPFEVLDNLESMFSRFDEIVGENNMERIKTIGDSYMCAGGIPNINATHPIDTIRTGLAFLDATNEFNEEQHKLGKPEWNLRIGVNTGNVVAGVIGKVKFAYDIWGDSVNLASRAESHGVTNSLNITENTYLLIKDKFECEYRGEVDVKNIGKVKMYIVIKEKTLV